MNDWNETQLSEDLQDVASKLRAARPEATEAELDDWKVRIRRRARHAREGGAVRRRLVPALLAGLLVLGGGSAVIASHGGSHGKGKGADRSQYCPPKSHAPGKEKNPPSGNGCGQPN